MLLLREGDRGEHSVCSVICLTPVAAAGREHDIAYPAVADNVKRHPLRPQLRLVLLCNICC